MRFRKALLALLLFFPMTGYGEKAERTLSGTAELSIVTTSGNTETETIGTASEILYKPGEWSGRARLNYLQNKVADDLKARSFNMTLRGSRELSQTIEGFTQFGYLRNRFAGFIYKASTDGGISVRAIEARKHKLKIDLGLGYTAEGRTNNEEPHFVNGLGGFTYEWRFSDSASIFNELSYFQNLKDLQDLRVTNTTSLSSSLTSIFSVKVSYLINTLSDPVDGFRSTDTQLSTALVARF